MDPTDLDPQHCFLGKVYLVFDRIREFAIGLIRDVTRLHCLVLWGLTGTNAIYKQYCGSGMIYFQIVLYLCECIYKYNRSAQLNLLKLLKGSERKSTPNFYYF